MQPMTRLCDLPEHMQTEPWIRSEIRYEEAAGIHTYHFCDCGGLCRGSRCAECWMLLLAQWQIRTKGKGE